MGLNLCVGTYEDPPSSLELSVERVTVCTRAEMTEGTSNSAR